MSSTRGIRLAYVLLFHIFTFVRSDLPVHCLRHQVAGDWKFFLSPMSSERFSCGHQRPDNKDLQPPYSLLDPERSLQVTLSDPNIAQTESDTDGRWTMIYDEGFEVNVEGLSLFAFSRFDLIHRDGHVTNISHCGETQVGWYQTEDRSMFGCYYGKKKTSDAETHISLLSHAPPRALMSPTYDAPQGEEYHTMFAEFLNMLQGSWTAKAYDWLNGKSLRDLNSMAGIYRSLPVSKQQNSGKKVAMSFLQREQSDDEQNGSRGPLPAAWDWRNVSGVNYLDETMDQGDCGACYTVATIRMLSARHRIRQQQPDLEPFSVNFPLQCSEYTQGCDGGYAFLVSKWSQDVGLVPDSCGKYAGSTGSCDMSCDPDTLSQRWRATNHHYVGGYYGGSSETEMMRELVEGGPLVASFEPTNELMYYGGGIFKTVPHKRSEWEQVDHAVLLIGFGEENGQKYWTLQNSWGPDWGEAGYFRMRRGTDESGIESIVVAADVVEDKQPVILQQFVQTL